MKKLLEKLYVDERLDAFFKVYYKATHILLRIKMVIEFIPIVWKHRDWDYGFITKFNLYLHKRLYKGLFVNGHLAPRPKLERHLKTIIACQEALENENDIGDKLLEDFERKWGTIEYNMGPGRFYNIRRESLSDDLKIKYDKELRIVYKKQDKLRKDYKDLMYKLMNKYHDHFWD